MSSAKKYRLNLDTLQYEVFRVSKKTILKRTSLGFLLSLVLAVVYFCVYTFAFELESPKLMILKARNARWQSKMEVLDRQIDEEQAILDGLEMRNDDIYRSIFGMSSIPEKVRRSGFDGISSSKYFADIPASNHSLRTARRLDVLTKAVYVQTKSFDEVATLSKRAGDMASCTPAIAPFCPEKGRYRMSSSFGYRIDPVYGRGAYHSGMDFAMKPGTPLYVTGDGVVEKVSFGFTGYGNEVLVDHGFGYKTRYAHMSLISVAEGMSLKRGDCIGQSGNTGKSTGPHLHYEVLYRGSAVNPFNYLDLDVSPSEYAGMVRNRTEQSRELLQQPMMARRR